MTSELLAYLRTRRDRCWWCGCAPDAQPHAADCDRPADTDGTRRGVKP